MVILLWMEGNNVGDLITPYIYNKLTNCQPKNWTNYYETTENVFYGAGSILNDFTTRKNVNIWGSGVITNNETLNKVHNIYAVRGPVTRKHLLTHNPDCPEIYGDPALCLPRIYKSKNTHEYKIGFIPHFVDYEVISDKFKNNKELHIISTGESVEKFIDEINKCDRIISTSLHGYIISHAYNINAVAIKIGNKLDGDGTKFIDYKLSVGLDDKLIEEVDINDNCVDVDFLIKLVDDTIQPIFPINTDLLWEVCPFRKEFCL